MKGRITKNNKNVLRFPRLLEEGMSMTKRNLPSIQETAFDCPHCGAYTTQYWYDVYADARDKNSVPRIPDKESMSHMLEDRNVSEKIKQDVLGFIEKIALGYVSLREGNSSKYARYQWHQ